MNMSLLDILHDGPVVPVIVIDRVEDAVPVARALVAGGVRVLEFTLRTRVALKAIERVVREVDGAIVGVGTLLRPQDLSDAVDVGAAFGVSPGLTVTSFRRDFGPGSYECTLRTRATNGEVSEPSNAVSFIVPQPVPGAPAGFSVD
jgi:hypothetical protein